MSHKRNLLVFSKLWWPEGGGAELATELAFKALSNEFNVVVISGTQPCKITSQYISRYVYCRQLKSPKPLELLNALYFYPALLHEIKKADIICVYSPLIFTIIAKKICPKKRVIVYLHSYQPLSYSSLLFIGKKELDIARTIRFEIIESHSFLRAIIAGSFSSINIFNRLALFYADDIICVSNRQAEIIGESIKEIKMKLKVVYNLLPAYPDITRCPSTRPNFLYLGGASPVKGFNSILSTINRMNNIFVSNNARIICAGLSNFPKNNFIVPIGRISHETVHKYYSFSWGLLAPSTIEETFSYSVAEAMNRGVIPIASKSGGYVELVQNTFAEKMLFNPSLPEEFGEKIKIILSLEKSELNEIGEQLRHAISKKLDQTSIKKSLKQVFTV